MIYSAVLVHLITGPVVFYDVQSCCTVLTCLQVFWSTSTSQHGSGTPILLCTALLYARKTTQHYFYITWKVPVVIHAYSTMVYCAHPHDQGQWDHSQKGFMFCMFTISVTFPILNLTVPLSFNFVMVYGLSKDLH
jgi:hypothetical protein